MEVATPNAAVLNRALGPAFPPSVGGGTTYDAP